jgi:hypothetical protein
MWLWVSGVETALSVVDVGAGEEEGSAGSLEAEKFRVRECKGVRKGGGDKKGRTGPKMAVCRRGADGITLRISRSAIPV